YFFSFYEALSHAALLSFPTRRSSDLIIMIRSASASRYFQPVGLKFCVSQTFQEGLKVPTVCGTARIAAAKMIGITPAMTTLSGRSEEHTSELQSQSNIVCRLLLEKKK